MFYSLKTHYPVAAAGGEGAEVVVGELVVVEADSVAGVAVFRVLRQGPAGPLR